MKRVIHNPFFLHVSFFFVSKQEHIIIVFDFFSITRSSLHNYFCNFSFSFSSLTLFQFFYFILGDQFFYIIIVIIIYFLIFLFEIEMFPLSSFLFFIP